MLAPFFLLSLQQVLPTASADALTDGPGYMHGNVGLRTTLSFGSDSLIESASVVGNRAYRSTRVDFYTEFAPIHNFSIALSLPYQTEAIDFSDVTAMQFSPQNNSGSYINTDAVDDFTREGSGIGGATVGIYYYPFHNRLYESRADRGAWKLGLAYRFASSQHFYSTDENGQRGSGPGAGALKFYGAFAVPSRIGQPYAEISAEHSGVLNGPIRNDSGEMVLSQGELRPPSRVAIRIGNEITLWEDTAFAHFAELDIYGKAFYTSWSDVTTSVLLPNTLKSYQNTIVNNSETTGAVFGLGTNIQ